MRQLDFIFMYVIKNSDIFTNIRYNRVFFFFREQSCILQINKVIVQDVHHRITSIRQRINQGYGLSQIPFILTDARKMIKFVKGDIRTDLICQFNRYFAVQEFKFFQVVHDNADGFIANRDNKV